METYILVYVTCPKDEAEKLAERLLQERLAACVNIVDNVKSVFHWQGKIARAEESLLMIKSKKSLLNELTNVVQMYHSYDVPEIIAMPILGGSDEYLNWLNAETLDL